MKAVWQGRTIAESSETREAHGYVYFPRDSVRMALLSRAEKTEDDLQCPHGVQFYDLADGTARSEREAWSYEGTGGATAAIANWVSFWEDVEVS